jgi:Tfp pilus assembly protein PilX
MFFRGLGGIITMKKCKKNHSRSGIAMILAIILLAVFSSLCLAMVSMSSSNVRSADNHRKAGRALASAQSGLEVVRFAMSPVYMAGDTQPADRFAVLADFLANDLGSTNLSNVTVDGATINLASSLNSEGQSFAATIQPTANIDILQVDVTGTAGSLDRDIRVSYNFGTRMHNVFDFGVATKGPLNMIGNTEISGINLAVEADVYIESIGQPEALTITGNSQIAGDVKITNPDGYPDLGPQAGVGGETGDAAYDHVESGAPSSEFPVPMPGYFEQYVTGITIDGTTNTSSSATYDNARIAGGTDPDFSANNTFRGVLFIETPNIVTFSGNVEIIGLIVGDGDVNDNSGTNRISFTGNISSSSVTELPEGGQFDGLRDETGTFLMAPGFATSFGGSFATLNGAIASNGVEFFGAAGGTIEGSVLNYSDESMDISGSSNLYFNRSGVTEVPAGFGPEIIMHYVSSSYSEIAGI